MKEFLIKLAKVVFLLCSGFFVFYIPYALLKRLILCSRDSKHYYSKMLPFHLDENAISRVRFVGQFFGIIFLTAVVVYFFLENTAPFGARVEYSSEDNSENSLVLGPKDRIKEETRNGQKILRQENELLYFTTKMPFQFDQATVKLTFQNNNPDQIVSIGFQDQDIWHYATKLLDIAFLNSLSWSRIGDNPVLYQRTKHFSSVQDFLKSPPQNSIIGTYDYDSDIGNTVDTRLPDYKPESKETVIDTPLRGKHTLYVYLQHEPFSMAITKQDLNWYEDPDPVTVKVYKDKDLVYQSTIDDDGIQDTSQKVLPPQELTIKNPGPGLPEDGIYKVVIDAGGDTIIKQIRTNLHKVVFQGSMFFAGNKSSYSSLIDATTSTTVYTNALTLSAVTYHNSGKQDIAVGNQTLHVNTLNGEEILVPKEDISKVVIPKNDVILSGYWGYFAFDRSQFFLPTPYHILPLVKKEDLNIADYVLTDYKPPIREGQWQIAEKTFDIRSAFIKNGRLSWVIEAPKLNENKNSILIKGITITLTKKPWF